MTREEVLQRVMEYFADQGAIRDDAASPDTPLSDTLLIDSLMVLETVMFLEQEFDLQLERSDLGEITSPEAVVELILRKTSKS